MPQIRLYLHGHNGSGLGEAIVECAVVPRIGQPLYLKGFKGIRMPEEEAKEAKFFVSSTNLVWSEKTSSIELQVFAQYGEGYSDDDAYRSAEETFGRWPPFG